MYGRTQLSRHVNPRFDSFGNYLMQGVSVFNWDEVKINSKHIDIAKDRYSYLEKTSPTDRNTFFSRYLGNLVVLSETNKAFSSRLIVGNEIGVKFSPLTLDISALNGVRWDLDVNDNYVTVITSRADTPAL